MLLISFLDRINRIYRIYRINVRNSS